MNALFATLLSFRQRFAEAAAALRRAIACSPADAGLCTMLGTILTLQGDLPGAAEAYTQALQIDPGRKEARSNLDIVEQTLRKEPLSKVEPARMSTPKS